MKEVMGILKKYKDKRQRRAQLKRMKQGFIIEDLNTSIQNGDYYKVALDWYAFKYLRCLSEKAILFYYTLFLAFLVFEVGVLLKNSFPLHQEFMLPHYSKDQKSVTRAIRALKDKDDLVSVALTRYLVEEYIRAREEYNYNTLESALNFLSHNSTSRVFVEYKRRFIDTKNPNSWVLHYQKNGTRTIEIKELQIIEDYNKHPYRAKATIETRETIKNRAQDILIETSVDLGFEIADLRLVHLGYLPFFFKVTDYHSSASLIPTT